MYLPTRHIFSMENSDVAVSHDVSVICDTAPPSVFNLLVFNVLRGLFRANVFFCFAVPFGAAFFFCLLLSVKRI